MITKKRFLRALGNNMACSSLSVDEEKYAGIWWDINTSIGTRLPYRISKRLIRIGDRLNCFRGRISDEDIDCVINSKVDQSEAFCVAFCNAMIDVGLYQCEWYFFDDENDDEYSIGVCGDDFDWYMEQYEKSVNAARHLGMTVSGQDVFHDDPNITLQYNIIRGDVSNPNSGQEGFDPIKSLYATCSRVNGCDDLYERTDLVTVSSDEIDCELKKIIVEALGQATLKKMRNKAVLNAVRFKIGRFQ